MSTKEQQFIVAFMKKSPSLIGKMFEGESQTEVFKHLFTPESWTLEITETRENEERGQFDGDTIAYFDSNTIYLEDAHMAYPSQISTSQIETIHYFTLHPEEFEDTIVFALLVGFDGQLYLGEFFGD